MGRNRRLWAVTGLVLLVFLSGCSLFGGGEISQDQLTKEAEYNWESNATAAYNVTTEPLLDFSADTYRAVLEVENQSTLSIHRESLLRGDQPVGIEALQFRFSNGTVVNASHDNLTAIQRSGKTDIELPAANGTVAYTAEWGGATGWGGGPRTWRVQTPIEGSHAVTMPEGARTTIPLLSSTRPGGHETTVENDRARLYWEDLDSGAISVRYYLVRDLYLFGTLLLAGLLLGAAGYLYYYRGIQRAREKREEVGLDVEVEDDSLDDGPPPGMG